MNIEIIAGSPREGSLTLHIAKHLYHELPAYAPSNSVGLINLQEHPLPFIQKVWTSAAAAPAEHRILAERMFAANAFIIVSPEYNGGYSPAMKNLFDHFPKQVKKTFGICTGSDGVMGGMRASHQLLQLVPALFGIASPTLLIVPTMDKKFDEEGKLLDESFSKKVHDFLTDFLWLANAVYNARPQNA
jgi:NAD(P)H-dependent FMN reductase